MVIFFWLILLLPVIEITLFIQAGHAIGFLNTILLCLLAGIAGSILIRYQGVSTLLAMQAVGRRGQVPLQQMFDGFCLALAGVLLVLMGPTVALPLLPRTPHLKAEMFVKVFAWNTHFSL